MNAHGIHIDSEFAMIEPTAAQSPLTAGFLAHCQELQGARPFPRWSDLKLYELSSDVLPFLAVVDVSGDPATFVYRYWGTGHTALKGVDMTGKPVAQIAAAKLAQIGVRQYDLVLEQRRPLVFIHELKDYGEWKDQLQVAARIPFSEDGETIDKVVSYSNYEEDREMWADVFHRRTSPQGQRAVNS